VAFEAERAGKHAKGYKVAKGGKTEAGGVTLVKARVPHHAAKSKPHRRSDD
jgi:hypothetical protein